MRLSHEGQAWIAGIIARQLEVEAVAGKRSDLAHHHRIIALPEDQKVVADGIRAAELLWLAASFHRPSEPPIAGEGQFDRGAKHGVVGHQRNGLIHLSQGRRIVALGEGRPRRVELGLRLFLGGRTFGDGGRRDRYDRLRVIDECSIDCWSSGTSS